LRRALSQMEGEQRQQAKKEKESDNDRSSARNALEKRVTELKVSPQCSSGLLVSFRAFSFTNEHDISQMHPYTG
jgi:hypothetical protein